MLHFVAVCCSVLHIVEKIIVETFIGHFLSETLCPFDSFEESQEKSESRHRVCYSGLQRAVWCSQSK